MRASVRVEISDTIPPEVMEVLKSNQAQVAEMIKVEAEATAAYVDRSGKLRKAARVEEPQGELGYIVRIAAPHAHLVEFGHGGPHPAPAHPFLRPAKEKVISQIR